MKTYSTWRPTGFDSPGLGLDDRQTWYVAPIGRNRDSDMLAESNWDVGLAMLGGESEDVEVHRFGHWACGWFEIILVRPDSEACTMAQRLEDTLAEYPVLDDEDFSRREEEEEEANERLEEEDDNGNEE